MLRDGLNYMTQKLVRTLLENEGHAVELAGSGEEAIEIARSNNPTFQAIRNNEALADWDVKAAYGSLLPSASTNFSLSWQGAGEQTFGSLTAEELGFADQPSFMFSRYGLNLNYSINGSALLAPGQAKISRVATRADVAFGSSELISQVTQNYIEVLRQTEQVRVSEQQRERARFNLRLAEAQLQVGTATAVDVAQAAVALGRAEVTILQTTNALETARIRLLQRMGVDLFHIKQNPLVYEQLIVEGFKASAFWVYVKDTLEVEGDGVHVEVPVYCLGTWI